MAVAEMGNHSVVLYQGGHKLASLASKRNYGGSSNYDCMYYSMGHWVVACIGPRHWHALSSYPLLKEP